MRNIVGWFLYNANALPASYLQRTEFYALKDRILRRFGNCDSNQMNLFTGEYEPVIQYQHFPAKECWHCTGYNSAWNSYRCDVCNDRENCCRCDGTGIYLPECWVELITYRLGRYQFHKPRHRVYENPGRTDIEGKIYHGMRPYELPQECYFWLLLFFWPGQFCRSIGYYADYTFRWNRPMVMLSTIVQALRSDQWRLVKPLLPHRLYYKMRHEWLCREPESTDDIPF